MYLLAEARRARQGSRAGLRAGAPRSRWDKLKKCRAWVGRPVTNKRGRSERSRSGKNDWHGDAEHAHTTKQQHSELPHLYLPTYLTLPPLKGKVR